MFSTLKRWFTMNPADDAAPCPSGERERRRTRRFVDGVPTLMTVIDDVNQRSLSARIVDATHGGMRIACASAMVPGDVVRCSLQVNRYTRVAEMQIVWCRTTGAGYEYGISCYDYSREFILEYLDFLHERAAA